MSMNRDNRAILIKKITIGLVVIIVLYTVVHAIFKSKPQPLPLPRVVAQTPVLTKVTDYVTQTGTMVAINSVNLVARVEGYLEAIEFTDGTFIPKDKELFIIEPQPYMEKVIEAESSVVAQKATYAYDKAEYERQKRMYKQNATSLNDVEKWAAKSQASKAEIDKAVANEAIAKINYSYTHVLAPFNGRIGRHLVDVGNLVGNGAATNLATIDQIDPIYVYFNLNELDLIKIRKAARTNAFVPAKITDIPVFVTMQNEDNGVHEGKLDFVNTGLNASTGTMEFRALLSNKDYALLPGLFVQVRIPVSKPTPQLTIPDTAVQYDQIGAYVLSVDNKSTVVLKRVALGALVQHDQRAILSGLSAQDKVIVSGLQNATPGGQVELVQNGTKSA